MIKPILIFSFETTLASALPHEARLNKPTPAKIKPNNFSPTVNLMRGKNNTPRLVFHGEWTSIKNLDLTNPEFFLSVEELSDVTPAVQKYQIFTAAQMPKSLDELISRQLYLADESSRINVLLKELRNGNLRWINRSQKCPVKWKVSRFHNKILMKEICR